MTCQAASTGHCSYRRWARRSRSCRGTRRRGRGRVRPGRAGLLGAAAAHDQLRAGETHGQPGGGSGQDHRLLPGGLWPCRVGVGPLTSAGISLPTIFAASAAVAVILGGLSLAVAHRQPSPAAVHPRPAHPRPRPGPSARTGKATALSRANYPERPHPAPGAGRQDHPELLRYSDPTSETTIQENTLEVFSRL